MSAEQFRDARIEEPGHVVQLRSWISRALLEAGAARQQCLTARPAGFS